MMNSSMGSGGPMIETKDLRRTFKSRKRASRPSAASTWRSRRARSSGSSARTAPARPPRCGCWRRCSSRPAAARRSPAPTWPGSRRGPRRIGYVPQGGSTDPAETGRGELVIQGRLYGMDKSAAQQRAKEVLAALDLEAAADRPTTTYSGGMRRRLDVGLGIVHRPRVLFLDEPTTGLDPQARARMWDEIRRLRERARRSSSRPTTSRRPTPSPTASRSSTTGRSWPRARPTSSSARSRATWSRSASTGDPEQVLATVRDQSFVREATAEDGLIRLYVDQGDTRRAAAPPAARWRRTSAPRR